MEIFQVSEILNVIDIIANLARATSLVLNINTLSKNCKLYDEANFDQGLFRFIFTLDDKNK